MEHALDRKIKILDFVIRDYIKHGEPVSSARVCEALAQGASPATIRNIMQELDEDGLLEQLHTSGGRVPTDKAYRYFVDALMRLHEPARRDRDMFLELRREAKRLEMATAELGRAVSEATKAFAVFAEFGKEKHLDFHGAQHLLGQSDNFSDEAVRSFAGMIDNLYEMAEAYRDEMQGDERVFIGQENPYAPARHFSVAGTRIKRGDSDSVILIIGPKRMDYEKGCSVLHYLIEDQQKEND
jgi:transcriptional regulator of heat shock response